MPEPSRRRPRGLVIGLAVAAVVAAGAFAIVANLGLLDASDDGQVGQLAATEDLPAAAPATAVTTVPAGGPAQPFTIPGVGTVDVVADAAGLAVGAVRAEPGWTWSAAQPSGSQLVVEFASAQRTVRFDAALATNGQVVATVADGSAPAPVTAAVADDHDDDHAEHEYEGGDDDD